MKREDDERKMKKEKVEEKTLGGRDWRKVLEYEGRYS